MIYLASAVLIMFKPVLNINIYQHNLRVIMDLYIIRLSAKWVGLAITVTASGKQ